MKSRTDFWFATFFLKPNENTRRSSRRWFSARCKPLILDSVRIHPDSSARRALRPHLTMPRHQHAFLMRPDFGCGKAPTYSNVRAFGIGDSSDAGTLTFAKPKFIRLHPMQLIGRSLDGALL